MWILQRVYHSGADEVYILPENGRISIGRSKETDIQIQSLTCSKSQCRIIVEGDMVVVMDMLVIRRSIIII